MKKISKEESNRTPFYDISGSINRVGQEKSEKAIHNNETTPFERVRSRALLIHIPGIWLDLEDLQVHVSWQHNGGTVGLQDPAKIGVLGDTAFARRPYKLTTHDWYRVSCVMSL